jgi:hypothetical protein
MSVLKVGGREFPLRRVGLTWQLMKFAKAQRAAQKPVPELDPDMPLNVQEDIKEQQAKRAEAGNDLLLTMHDTLLRMVHPDHRDQLVEFLDEAELEPNELEEAIGNAIAEVSGPEGETVDPQKGGLSSPSSESPSTTSESSPGTSAELPGVD